MDFVIKRLCLKVRGSFLVLLILLSALEVLLKFIESVMGRRNFS